MRKAAKNHGKKSQHHAVAYEPSTQTRRFELSKAIITYGARGADFNQKKPSWGA